MALFDIHAYFGSSPLFGGVDTQEQTLAAMQRYGLDAVALVSSRARHSDLVEGNHQLRQVLDAEQGIFGYVTANTSYPDESIQEMRLYLAKHNFIGTAIFPHQHTPVMLTDAREILNAARRYTKPVLIYADDREGIRAIRQIAEEFDQTKIVILNMGGEDWHAAVQAAKTHANLFLEISGELDADKLAHTVGSISARKLLFGSSLPNADPSLYVGMINETTSLSQGDRRRISYQNALNLFNIEAELE